MFPLYTDREVKLNIPAMTTQFGQDRVSPEHDMLETHPTRGVLLQRRGNNSS